MAVCTKLGVLQNRNVPVTSMLRYMSTKLFIGGKNPPPFDVDNIRFLGTSGHNIDDLEKYSEVESKLGFVERTLRVRRSGLICIPQFFETGVAVVVNLRNLECQL
ncbi:hypothetical protein F2Q68_00034793 [Brassica cretica]|uniref:Uncharacterized protein n=1 Tax=Brassica cretica TaxID=69181 RepID=A0A8S9GWE1_BRACR|nr:hypothetical protein F2Q68_00034793 [Brassica cretica]